MTCLRTIPCLVLALTLLAAPAAAGEARQALEPKLDQMLSILSDPRYEGGEHFEEQKQRIKTVIQELVDFKLFTQLALGKRHWMEFSGQQQERLVDVFTRLMERKYLDRIREYTNEKVRYVSEEVSSNGRKARIETEIVSSKVGQVPVTYSLYKDRGSGEWRVYDLKVEGISMLSNWRTQFSEALQKMSPEELIQKMEKQAKGKDVESLSPTPGVGENDGKDDGSARERQ
ncbi:MAG: ABC transporter substrate-binding protein [Desulfovibrionaceae bacterium]